MEPAQLLDSLAQPFKRVTGTQSMRLFGKARPTRVVAMLLVSVAFAANGCSRKKYRLQADHEVYDVIAERNVDQRWRANHYGIDIDQRSRYFDPNDPDCPPMPRDDPASNQYMKLVDGKRGWEHWDDFGTRTELENPGWYDSLNEYVAVSEDGSIRLNVDSALKLAYIHSPNHQRQLETLYLSALDVTADRFRLDTQFFGGYDAVYTHTGSLAPAALRFDPISKSYVVTQPVQVDGLETNRLSLGRPSAAAPALQLNRRLATAGQLLAGFANSFVFEFTGRDANLSASLANFTFIQPLLRGAGRDVALEGLTFTERTLLANLRSYSQFRQGFYTQVAIGELGVTGPQRGGRGTSLFVFSGLGGVGGYAGLLQQLQEIRNSEDNLSLQLRTLAQLEALLAVGVIDLVQVDQFRQSVESERANLVRNRNDFQRSLDIYKTQTLGLPPDLLVKLDDSLIRQFQLVAREATGIQDSIGDLQDLVGKLPDDASVDDIRQLLRAIFQLIEPVQMQLQDVQSDLDRMEQLVPDRELLMSEVERALFAEDREQLHKTLTDLNEKFRKAKADFTAVQDSFSEQTREETVKQVVVWLGNLLRLVQRSVLVQARARLETVTVEDIDLQSDDAFEIALENRLDFMNGRAALVDSWRLVQVRADALQSVLNLTANGDVRTARNNPFSFRAPTGSLRLGLEFDAPFTRLLERNDYREALIEYQRSRRAFIQSRDALHLGLRELLRQIEQLRTNLETQRRAVAIAIRRVDLTRSELYAPVPPPQPGQPAAQFGPTAAFNLLSSLSSLRDTQNSFLSVWLNYYAARMRLSRELGVMVLDASGRWSQSPPPIASADNRQQAGLSVPDELPPAIPSIPAIPHGAAMAPRLDVQLLAPIILE